MSVCTNRQLVAQLHHSHLSQPIRFSGRFAYRLN